MPPFQDVVTRHGPTVLRVCRAVVGWDDAEDAWSETFLAALRAYPELPSTANVEAWLVTIAHRKAIDQHRGRSRRAVPLAELPEIAVAPVHPDDELWSALAALPPMQRQAAAYHYVGGLPYREVAAILGNSEAAARRAGADAVKALRQVLVRTEGHPSRPSRPAEVTR